MYNTVIFDLDGTLLNTIEDLADAVVYVQKQYGFPQHDLKTVKCNVGNGIKKLMERSVPDGKDNPQFEEAYACFKEYYQAHCQVKTREYDGIKELLGKLKQDGINMAIVSNKAHEAVEELNQIYFKNYIDIAVGENEDAGIRKKPAKDMVMLALDKICENQISGGANTENKAGIPGEHTGIKAVYVGDSEVDRATAENSGLDCILVSWGFRDKKLLESLNPKKIVDDTDELYRSIKGEE